MKNIVKCVRKETRKSHLQRSPRIKKDISPLCDDNHFIMCFGLPINIFTIPYHRNAKQRDIIHRHQANNNKLPAS